VLTYVTRDRLHNNGNGLPWYRSTAARSLLAAALMTSLLLGAAVVLIGRLHSTPGDSLYHPAQPVSDDQSESQVLEPVRQIVTTAKLQRPTAGYSLMSCKDVSDPPYQGAIYLNFALPADVRIDMYFRSIADAMVGHGWREGLPPSRYSYGSTLYRSEVTAIVYQDNNIPSIGVLRVYGQCRNMNNHRHDTTAWTDITDQLPRPR
jgi:hypothetical protein